MGDFRVKEVMTREVVRARRDTPFKEVARLLAEHRISGLPVVDDQEKVVGVISETDLLYHQVRQDPDRRHRRFHVPRPNRSARSAAAKAWARTAEQLMTRPAFIVAPEQHVTDAASMMDLHHVARLPVVDDEDRLVGIVTRGNLLKLFLRPDAEIGRDVVDRLVRGIDCPRYEVDAAVADGVVTLRGHLARRGDARLAARIAGQVDGVVAITDHLTYDSDGLRP
ncbi:CBS domain-containing protein [Streptomyces sp. STR69]|uniref:CBS domain-containing protein n=1 Tax=Streptomyces sp. STR69 TaxID=1796942 RepID=UPI0021C65E84|nr:CBS domain-containing protein [Streptomyces sp. STR69]